MILEDSGNILQPLGLWQDFKLLVVDYFSNTFEMHLDQMRWKADGNDSLRLNLDFLPPPPPLDQSAGLDID